MSDTSRPQRIEKLESSVGEMKIELSRTRAQIEQMMGMIQQLLQAKSAGGGQQEEKSGGSGRGDATDDSGGAGREPCEEGDVGTRVGATAAEHRMDQDLPTTRAGDQRFQLAWAR